MIFQPLVSVPRTAVVAYRDDGPLSKGMGRLVAGEIPPLPPAVAGAFVTGALLVVGVASADNLAVVAPAVVLLLAGSGSFHPHRSRLDWLVPPILRLTEYTFVACVGFARAVPPALIFALLGALAYHHYTTVYRLRNHLCPPSWLALAGLGWDGRMLVLAMGGLLDVVTVVVVLLASYLWGLFGWETLTWWLASLRVDSSGSSNLEPRGLTGEVGD